MRSSVSIVLFVALVTFVDLEHHQVNAQFAHPSIWMQRPKFYQIRTIEPEPPTQTVERRQQEDKGKFNT